MPVTEIRCTPNGQLMCVHLADGTSVDGCMIAQDDQVFPEVYRLVAEKRALTPTANPK